MATEIRPPEAIPDISQSQSVFLAGSIDQGTAEDWQTKVVGELADKDCVILNPRRAEWDASWKQDIENQMFRQQVEWELQGLESAKTIAVFFAPETQAPVTLLELGLFAHTDKLLVCCPAGYWRKGNVDIVCNRYGIENVPTFEQLIVRLRERVESEA